MIAMVAAILRIELQWSPETRRFFGIGHVVGWQLEVLWHDADDFARDAIDLNRSAEHIGPVEPRLPQLVAQDDDRRRVRGRFRVGEVATHEGLHAQHREKIGGDEGAADANRIAITTQVELADTP